MEMEEESCGVCGSKEGFEAYNGFYFCVSCNTQVEGRMETCSPEQHLNPASSINLGRHRTRLHKMPMPEASPSPEHVASEIRMRYVMGIQHMIQSQSQVLIQHFGASPMIANISSLIWFRFLASTRLFDPNWADHCLTHSELHLLQTKGVPEKVVGLYQDGELVNMYGKSMTKIWLKSLKNRIPLSYSLAISFLSCHMARDPILPTDIYKWALEGQLPYLTAFLQIPTSTTVCPFTSSFMFKPFNVVESREIELHSASVAHQIGLQLPPLNFFAIARRYLNQLSLPFQNILRHVVCIFEWVMPPDIWLSTNPQTLPTRVCVMSVILFTLRILCNINGFGYWEASLSKTHTKPKRSTSVPKGFLHVPDSDINSQELLSKLEAVYKANHDAHDYSNDLPTYLDYCKNVVFVGINPLPECNQEEWIIEKLWKLYEDAKDLEAVGGSSSREERNPKGEETRSLKKLKLNMAENGFCYIPPRDRKRVKRYDYLHYIRKNDQGSRNNVAHADYYILLRACAKVAEIGIEDMHARTLELEKRFSLIENIIDQSFSCH